MQISFIRSPEEVLLDVTRADLARIADQVAAGAGRLGVTSIAEAGEDVEVLVRLVVEEVDGALATVFIDEQSRSLGIRGGSRARRLLAEDLRLALADRPTDSHWHLEHEPDHPFLAMDSMPVVLRLTD